MAIQALPEKATMMFRLFAQEKIVDCKTKHPKLLRAWCPVLL
jgi:hypothetical protein